MPQLPPLRRCLGPSERDHGGRVPFSTSKCGSVRPRPASPPSFSTPTSRSRRLGLSGRDDGGGAPLSASLCGPMPSPTRASVASLPTAGAVLPCRAHRASRWPTHTRWTLHPKKPACAWEERVLDADKYAIMHCGVQVSRLHACRLNFHPPRVRSPPRREWIASSTRQPLQHRCVSSRSQMSPCHPRHRPSPRHLGPRVAAVAAATRGINF
jgi:hypothetical protein